MLTKTSVPALASKTAAISNVEPEPEGRCCMTSRIRVRYWPAAPEDIPVAHWPRYSSSVHRTYSRCLLPKGFQGTCCNISVLLAILVKMCRARRNQVRCTVMNSHAFASLISTLACITSLSRAETHQQPAAIETMQYKVGKISGRTWRHLGLSRGVI